MVLSPNRLTNTVPVNRDILTEFKWVMSEINTARHITIIIIYPQRLYRGINSTSSIPILSTKPKLQNITFSERTVISVERPL
jgi:hypothetical protein